jgi:hypothetical protein
LKTGAEPPPGVREADIDEDTAWAILRDFLKVWGQLPGPLGESARKTSMAIFGSEGLSFVQLPVEEEKAVGDAKRATFLPPVTPWPTPSHNTTTTPPFTR